jgi:hypothetical protein
MNFEQFVSVLCSLTTSIVPCIPPLSTDRVTTVLSIGLLCTRFINSLNNVRGIITRSPAVCYMK